jgi:hypothetical protein
MTRLAWGLAVALVPVGIATYLYRETDWAWVLGLLMLAPFAYLAMHRAQKRGGPKDGFGGDGGVWGSP